MFDTPIGQNTLYVCLDSHIPINTYAEKVVPKAQSRLFDETVVETSKYQGTGTVQVHINKTQTTHTHQNKTKTKELKSKFNQKIKNN